MSIRKWLLFPDVTTEALAQEDQGHEQRKVKLF